MSVPPRSLDKLTVCKAVGNTTNNEDVENCLEKKLQERPQCKCFFSAGSTLYKCGMLKWSVSGVHIPDQIYWVAQAYAQEYQYQQV